MQVVNCTTFRCSPLPVDNNGVWICEPPVQQGKGELKEILH